MVDAVCKNSYTLLFGYPAVLDKRAGLKMPATYFWLQVLKASTDPSIENCRKTELACSKENAII